MVTYRFDAAFPDDHFVSDYIAWASTCTDASWEFHEAVALAILSAAVPDVRADLPMYPNGLPTNLYIALIGDTTSTRKSTAMALAQKTYRDADPNGAMPERMTPEGFIDQLAQRSPGTSLWVIDEFGKWLGELHNREHLAGLQGLLLQAYGGNDYTYARSKKKGQSDDVKIERPHLTIVGGTTPLIFDKLHLSDVESGLLPRFAIIMPDTKPARLPFYELGNASGARAHQNGLVRRIAALRPVQGATPRAIRFTDECLRVLDEKISALETSQHLMHARLPMMLTKLAMLAAIGRPWTLGQKPNEWEVTVEDARCALAVMVRWEAHAVRFQQLLGESDIEQQVKKVVAFFRNLNSKRPDDQQRDPLLVRRSTVARYLHVEANDMKAVEAVLIDREVIKVDHDASRRRDSSIWTWNGQDAETRVA